MKKAGIIAVALVLSACSEPAPQPRPQEARPSAADLAKADADMGVVPSKMEPTKPLTPGETASVCKAAIAELFGHSPKIMKVALASPEWHEAATCLVSQNSI